MRRGEQFPDGRAEIELIDDLVERLSEMPQHLIDDILIGILALCENPAGKHPLSGDLAGLNTVEADERRLRTVYRATPPSAGHETALIEIVTVGPRRDGEVYTIAAALVDSGVLDEEQATQIWDALELLDTAAEQAGLDGWDYKPPPAAPWLIDGAVNAGFDRTEVEHLSHDELSAAMADLYETGNPDDAVTKAMGRVNTVLTRQTAPGLSGRADARCGKYMRRARASCIRRKDHPGPCRST